MDQDIDEMIKKFHEHIEGPMNEDLTDGMFESKTYELVSVAYTASPRNSRGNLKTFAQESEEMGSHELLKTIRKYESEGTLLAEGGLEGNKYFIMINHDNLSPNQWSFKPHEVPANIFYEENYLGLVHQMHLEGKFSP